MSNSFKGYPTATPWRITGPDERKGREIVGADGSTVAKLTALDMSNAELIVELVNRSAAREAARQSISEDQRFRELLDEFAYRASERRAMGGDFGSADNEEVAESALIAHIDTWGGTAPATSNTAPEE